MRYVEKKICPDYPQGARNDNYQPMLYGYLMEESRELVHSAQRPAVIVCPGGAYRFKSDREGEPVVMWFLAAGMQAFVLQYSVAPNRYPAAFLELAAAVAEVRAHAKEWHIDPEKIMICGFSAGGHLCASLGTDWKNPLLTQHLSCARYLWRPDGMILCYPVISMAEYGHEECRKNLMGEHFSKEFADRLSWQKHVTADTVPAFLWATFEDEQVPVENSLLFAASLRGKGVPCELHLYEKGEHGLSLCDEMTEERPSQILPDNAGWFDLAVRWIRRRGGK